VCVCVCDDDEGEEEEKFYRVQAGDMRLEIGDQHSGSWSMVATVLLYELHHGICDV